MDVLVPPASPQDAFIHKTADSSIKIQRFIIVSTSYNLFLSVRTERNNWSILEKPTTHPQRKTLHPGLCDNKNRGRSVLVAWSDSGVSESFFSRTPPQGRGYCAHVSPVWRLSPAGHQDTGVKLSCRFGSPDVPGVRY